MTKNAGVTTTVIPSDDAGQVDVDALAATFDERVELVSLVHVPTEGGLINPAAAVAEVTRAAGVPLLLDACQSVGRCPSTSALERARRSKLVRSSRGQMAEARSDSLDLTDSVRA